MSDNALLPYDSFLLVSFGGPEGPDEVMPFLENVVRGRNVPRDRLLEVAEHYQRFGGTSPINAQNRALLGAIADEFRRQRIDLPVYWGNRNWKPTLVEALRQMRDDGRRHALAFFTSMHSCYSGCRQYRENIAEARQAVGDGAPRVDKLRFGFNHPGFIAAMREQVRAAITELPGDAAKHVTLLMTAHSLPIPMAENSEYEKQLRESSRLIAAGVPHTGWHLVYQSRSGSPRQPWLEPDVCDFIRRRRESGEIRSLVIVPVGFISDHMEVIYDLDEEAAALCKDLGIAMRRAGTVGTEPRFVEMIAQLIRERIDPSTPRLVAGELGAWHDVCPSNCCLPGVNDPRPDASALRPPTGSPGSA